jgi:lysophospholipase L1-like esterase
MKTCIRVLLPLLSFLAMTQVQATTPPAASQRSLIIIGASYAASWGEPALPGFKVANKGKGGEESTAVRARFDRDVLANKPDAVLVWGHINDIFRAPPEMLEQVKRAACENFRAMHEQARAAGIEMLIATEVTLTVGDGWLDQLRGMIGRLRGRENYNVTINRHVKDVNACLRTYAAAQQLKLLDLEKAVDSGNGSRRAEYSTEDGSHISAAGYAALTRYAVQNLRQGAAAAP